MTDGGARRRLTVEEIETWHARSVEISDFARLLVHTRREAPGDEAKIEAVVRDWVAANDPIVVSRLIARLVGMVGAAHDYAVAFACKDGLDWSADDADESWRKTLAYDALVDERVRQRFLRENGHEGP